MKLRIASRWKRTQNGAALVEGSVALMVITWTSVLCVFFALATVLILFYKIKLAYITGTVANAAAQGRYWLGAQRANWDPVKATADATALTSGMTTNFGLGFFPGVTVDYSTGDYCGVKVSAINLPLLNGPLVPAFMTLNDACYVPFIKHAPVGWYGLTMQNSGGGGMGLYYPSYGAGDGTPPPTSTPTGALKTYAVNTYGDGVGALVGGPTMAGTYQNWDNGGPFSAYY